MEKILTYKGAVMTWECDSNRHMNVMYYVNKFEHASRHFIGQMALDELQKREHTGIVVLEQQINYFREVLEDDLLYVESSLVEIGNKAFTLFHEMYHTHTRERVATMKVVTVLFDKVNRKALPFPDDKRKRLLE